MIYKGRAFDDMPNLAYTFSLDKKRPQAFDCGLFWLPLLCPIKHVLLGPRTRTNDNAALPQKLSFRGPHIMLTAPGIDSLSQAAIIKKGTALIAIPF